jgi:uncharacterized protein YihD (DUF1040 family)
MRDPNRIHHMLQVLRNVWTLNPDLRLGQLIDNARFFDEAGYAPECDTSVLPIYLIEDEDMENCLKGMLRSSVDDYEDN